VQLRQERGAKKRRGAGIEPRPPPHTSEHG
jgi:hypothetical protein